jgi:hypothetical protein
MKFLKLTRQSSLGLYLAAALVFSGCTAKSMYAVGIEYAEGNRLVGVVSQRTANKSHSFIRHFHSLISRQRYSDAYQKLSRGLREKLSLSQFKEDFYYLDTTYGPEQSFEPLFIPVTGSLPNSDMALYLNGFTYYEAVISNYLSQRNTDIIYSFAIVKEGLGIKIGSLGFSDQKSWEREYKTTTKYH